MSHIIMHLDSCTTCLHTAMQVIRNRIYGFMKRLVSSSNALVLSAVTSDTRFRSRIVRHLVLVPIVKDKQASVCSTSNYRPIALASIMSKLLEKIILNRISDNLVTNPNQFGFKPKHNTEMCIFALKEAILKYRALNSNVYSCFLDASNSKAFDRVNHSKLFDTLVKRGVPNCKYLGHCINDKLIDDDDMARQRKQI